MQSRALTEVDRLAVLVELILDEMGGTAKANVQDAMDALDAEAANRLVRRYSRRAGVQQAN
jgi:hypothetical protein